MVPWPFPADGAITHQRNVALPAIERGDQWVWSLRLKNHPAQLLGVLHLRQGEQNHRGFWGGLPWQRQRLMIEACAWANDFWFETLGFPVLRVAKAAANLGSRRISEKQGMRLVGTSEKVYVCGRLPTENWEITARVWRDRKSSS